MLCIAPFLMLGFLAAILLLRFACLKKDWEKTNQVTVWSWISGRCSCISKGYLVLPQMPLFGLPFILFLVIEPRDLKSLNTFLAINIYLGWKTFLIVYYKLFFFQHSSLEDVLTMFFTNWRVPFLCQTDHLCRMQSLDVVLL